MLGKEPHPPYERQLYKAMLQTSDAQFSYIKQLGDWWDVLVRLETGVAAIDCGRDITTGEPTGTPCEIPLKTYPVSIVDGNVQIEV